MKKTVAGHFGKEKAIQCRYVYDFGDDWEHDLVLKGVVDYPERFGRRLLDGARAFPPEDCGGSGSYEYCVAVATGKRKDREQLEWLEGWHPEDFDLKAAAQRFDQAKLILKGRYESGP